MSADGWYNAPMFDWILHVIETGGYAGIFFLMVLENIFPPIPSEVVLPLTGFAAADGSFNVVLVILAATAGTIVGALPWYVAGRLFTLERLKALSARYGRVITLTPDELDYAAAWFARHGRKAVLLGRLMPIVRTLISVPAGLTRMPLPLFLAYSAIGTLLWTSALVGAGYLLESQYARVSDYVNPVANAIVLLIVGSYLYRVVTFGRRTRSNGS